MAPDLVEFAVTDVETTGLFPGRHDRIVEIAVIRMRGDGTVLGEFATLVNPERDMGPTHLHGIHAGDVLEAPTFREIVGDISALLGGAILVAHNASFDVRFLQAELERAGFVLPPVPVLCTMRLAHLADPDLPSRRLADLCSYFNVQVGQAHSAQDDARATSRLMAACLETLGGGVQGALGRLGIGGSPPPRTAWPMLAPCGRTLPRARVQHGGARAESYLSHLVGRLPPGVKGDARAIEYEALLDRVLEDRRIHEDEREALEAFAAGTGLTQAQAREVHQGYLFQLLRAALLDGVISDAEASDLRQVQALLGVNEATFEHLKAEAAQDLAVRLRRPPSGDLSGKSVCFTGELECTVLGSKATRPLAQELARQAGMTLKSGVSKKLDMLVLADPDSMSGKAKRARELSIRCVAEPVFWRMLGIDVE